MSNTFNALVLNQEDGKTTAGIEKLSTDNLPEANVTVNIDYSSLNYKDGLAITGKGKIIRNFPMVPGIDFSGTVSASLDERYNVGDSVVLTGWGVGERHWGGIAEKACVNGDWLVKLPENLSSKKAMIVGTAGLTAMLCVQALVEAGVTPDSGDVLVTGASGGVGSVAVRLLSKLGYTVVAVTGRSSENGDWLKSLGASQIIERADFEEPAKPLEKACWAAAVDTVGSKVLAKVLAQINYGGAVAICGLAGGADLPTTVMPFILRGVSLLGVDSVQCPKQKREHAWQQLASLLPEGFYDEAGEEITLDQVTEYAAKIVNGQVTGRTLIKIN